MYSSNLLVIFLNYLLTIVMCECSMKMYEKKNNSIRKIILYKESLNGWEGKISKLSE